MTKTEQVNQEAPKEQVQEAPKEQVQEAPPAEPLADDKPIEGELVPPTHPQAKAALDAMVLQMIGEGPSAQEILTAIVGGESLPDEDAAKSQAGIVARILAAEGADGVLDMGEPVKASEIEQVALEVRDVRWMRSTVEGGSGVYAVIDAERLDTKETIKVTCGSVNVMTQLLKLQTMGALPQQVKIVKSARATQSGYYPYWLQPA